jgi:hypothetical protein
MSNESLLSALQKFLEWQKDYETLQACCGTGDSADQLMFVLYGRSRVSKLIGGSNCPILLDAAKEIQKLRDSLDKIRKCDRCHGAGWCWWNELDNFAGHDMRSNDVIVDDTKYTCDKCGGNGFHPDAMKERENDGDKPNTAASIGGY